jgi:hemoglobin-like flavoprotein
MSADSSGSNDELIREFIEKNKEFMVDPEQYPKVFRHLIRMFLYEKGLLK